MGHRSLPGAAIGSRGEAENFRKRQSGKPDLRDLFEQLRTNSGFLPRCFVTERPKFPPCKDEKVPGGIPCVPVSCSGAAAAAAAAVQLAGSYPVVAKPIPRGFFESPLQSLVACRSSYLAGHLAFYPVGLGPAGLSGGEQFGLGPGRSPLPGGAGGPGGPGGPPGTGAGGPLHHGFPLPATFPWAATARGKPRRGMMRRAVFSDAQRQGLEKRFQIQKYISKPDRKKLAEKLGLKDSQASPLALARLDCRCQCFGRKLATDKAREERINDFGPAVVVAYEGAFKREAHRETFSGASIGPGVLNLEAP
ncbi:hypothetical protein HPB50_003340 [Hyalomma asiaticum]|uniref:Uncharacterized protein n=1 Tax=Hyalomma asiaticum TaxID=266040 RepID=A0ACB7SM26_HYAAI|nr:hypothetical protein HPB50_003340 [Hyalomma asiaticum]